MVCAPSVVKTKDGKFHMYVSVGSGVWAGVSVHPLSPWKNAKADNIPLINSQFFLWYHMLDAECFINDDGEAYLYWGSGLNWINGKCFAVKLKNDMVTFDGSAKDMTPPNYFEAPFILNRNGMYYLMYSEGKRSILRIISDTPLERPRLAPGRKDPQVQSLRHRATAPQSGPGIIPSSLITGKTISCITKSFRKKKPSCCGNYASIV